MVGHVILEPVAEGVLPPVSASGGRISNLDPQQAGPRLHPGS